MADGGFAGPHGHRLLWGRVPRGVVCPAGGLGQGERNCQRRQPGDFKPDQSVTRQELAAFLTRFDQYRGVPLAEGSLNLYSDANMTGVWAVESMRHAVGMGWLDGDGGRLLPGGVATRAQLAVILQRLTTQAMG